VSGASAGVGDVPGVSGMQLGPPWSATAGRDAGGVLRVGGVGVDVLAAEHGTPLYVLDGADLRARCRAFVAAFGADRVIYASKAWCNVAVLQIVAAEGLLVDVASAGELETALVAGIDPARLVLHGNNKSDAELDRALEVGVGRIVIDAFEELERLDALARSRGVRAPVLLRITPGIDAHTHEYVRTGHDDAKFGFTLSLGLADAALRRTLELDALDLRGVHAHIGSQVFGTDAFVANAEVIVDLLARWRDEHGIELHDVDLGGGMGVAYVADDAPVAIAEVGAAVQQAVAARATMHGLEGLRLLVEPGRAIVAPTTLTLYRVGVVKDLPGLSRWIAVDGGMGDNIRPALYGAVHTVALASRASTADVGPANVVGKHCESGDVLADRAPLPRDVAAGDLLAIATTGAYTESMASTYNRIPRAAAVLVEDGVARTILRRETLEDVLARDVPLDAPLDVPRDAPQDPSSAG
jgi:diaminopimelate decarboxylase